jgi:hypothetical protein
MLCNHECISIVALDCCTNPKMKAPLGWPQDAQYTYRTVCTPPPTHWAEIGMGRVLPGAIGQ